MPVYLIIFLKLLPTIVALIPHVEELFKDQPKSGAQKKAFILEIAEHLAGGADATFTGGAADTWARIRPLASIVIDAGASIAFPHPAGGAFGSS